MKTLRTLTFGTLLLALAGVARGTDYHVAPRPGSGSGTADDPFGLDDLPKGKSGCRATEVLRPGDALYFKAGDYHLTGAPYDPGQYERGLIFPGRSGTREQPITIAAAPGESVRLFLDGGSNPILGTFGPDNQPRNYVRFVGLELRPGAKQPGIRIVRAEGVEVAYCRFVGEHLESKDNHEGIRLDHAVRAWVHHCEVSGVKGEGINSAAVKLYFSTDSLFEDCYFHDCTAGFFDKKDGVRTTLRRSVILRCSPPVRGNELHEGPAGMTIEDCVLEGSINFNARSGDSQIHDNLFFSPSLAEAGLPSQTGLEIWNNIVIAPGPTVKVVDLRAMSWAAPGRAEAPVAYLDHNLYVSDAGAAPTPTYEFGAYKPPASKLDFRAIRSARLERHSQSVAGGRGAVFERGNRRLLERWAKAGRHEDPPGPDDLATLLDLSRYGPEARPATPAP